MIRELKVMKGPSVWSAEHPRLVVLKLEPPITDKNGIKDLCAQLSILLPSISQSLKTISTELRENSEKVAWAGIFALVCLELQQAGYANKAYHNVSEINNNVYSIYEYTDEELAVKASEVCAAVLKSCLTREWNESFESYIKILRKIFVNNAEGPTTNEILTEAEKRNIP